MLKTEYYHGFLFRYLLPLALFALCLRSQKAILQTLTQWHKLYKISFCTENDYSVKWHCPNFTFSGNGEYIFGIYCSYRLLFYSRAKKTFEQYTVAASPIKDFLIPCCLIQIFTIKLDLLTSTHRHIEFISLWWVICKLCTVKIEWHDELMSELAPFSTIY